MESFPVESLILVVVASIVAFLIGRFTSKGREDIVRLQGELEESRKALQDYRKQVTSHFRGTAQRVDALTESYRDVYKHLARGAQALCEKSEAPQLLNEAKHIPTLDREAFKSAEMEPGGTSSEPESEKGSQSQNEPEKASESGSDAGDESEAKSVNKGKGRGDPSADSKASLKGEPEAAAEKPVRESAV